MMSSSNLFSLRASESIRQHLNGENFELVWYHPSDDRCAVILVSSSSAGPKTRTNDLEINVKKEEETSEIFVRVKGNKDCYGLEDKLNLLFSWKKLGGSNVSGIEKLAEAEFKLAFEDEWDAVLSVCRSSWTLNEKELQVVPYFKCFGSPNMYHQDTAEVSSSADSSRTGFSKHNAELYRHCNSEIANQDKKEVFQSAHSVRTSVSCKDNAEVDPCLNADKATPDYPLRKLIKMHNAFVKKFPHPSTSAIDSMKPNMTREDMSLMHSRLLKNHPECLPFPCVKRYLSNDGVSMKEEVEQKFKCHIELEEDNVNDVKDVKEKEIKLKKFSVTLLYSHSFDKYEVHLVQGNASKVKADIHHHFRKGSPSMPKTLKRVSSCFQTDCLIHDVENKLNKINERTFFTLAISLDSKFSTEIRLEEFAKIFLEKIEMLFRGKKRHILLCEMDNLALLEAFKYMIIRNSEPHNINKQIWETISVKDSDKHQFHCLRSKVQVVHSFCQQDYNHPGESFICLPIDQNLESASCPVKCIETQHIVRSVRKALENLTMTEEEMYAFEVGSTYKLKCSDPLVHLYCTQGWDINVDKSVQDSLTNCLNINVSHKNRVLYIYPPGIFNPKGPKYPVEFAVEKCLQTLASKIALVKQHHMIYLIVPDQQYHDAFNKILKPKQPTKSSKLSGSKSSVTFYGPSDSKLDEAKKALESKLSVQMKDNCREINRTPNMNDFIKHLESSPPGWVHLEINGRNIKVASLIKSDVDDCLRQLQFTSRINSK